MELDQLRIIKAIVETGSVRQTAVKLGRTKSSISRQLAALEQECGQVFRRRGKQLLLTELGETISPKIDLILKAATKVVELTARPKDSDVEEVRLAMTPAIGLQFLERLFHTLRKSSPQIRLHVTEGSSAHLQAELEERNIDVAVLLRQDGCSILNDQVICALDTFLVGPTDDPVLQQEEIPFAALEGLPLLMGGPPSLSYNAFKAMSSCKGVKLSVVARANMTEPTTSLVRGRIGYFVTPLWVCAHDPMSIVDKEIRSGRLRAARIVNPDFPRTLVVSSAADPSSGAQVVAREAKNILLSFRAN